MGEAVRVSRARGESGCLGSGRKSQVPGKSAEAVAGEAKLLSQHQEIGRSTQGREFPRASAM